MDPIPDHIQSLEALLLHVDACSGGFRPIELDSVLRALLQRHPEAETNAGHAWYDEVAAGSMRLARDEKGPWGLEYGPLMEGQSETGELLTYPILERLDSQTLDYWRKRARETGNPGLKARYADLAWVVADRFGEKRALEDGHLAIDGYLASVASLPDDFDVEAIQNARRAMTLALKIKDQTRQAQIKDGMFALARRLEAVPSTLRRSFLLDGFGLGAFTKVPLSDEERAYMLWLLEDRLEKELKGQDSKIPTGIGDAENAAQLLSTFYRKKQCPAEVKRVLEAFGEVVHRRTDKAEPMAGQAWLEGFARLCDEYGQKELAIRAIQALQALGPKVLGSLKRFSHEMEVPKEQMEGFVAQFLQGDLAEALGRLAVNMVPKWDQVVQQTQELAQKAVFSSLMPKTFLDGMGLPTVQMPSYDENPEVHFPLAFSQRIQMEGFFRFHVIEKIKSKFAPTANDLTDWLMRSPAFQPEHRPLLEHGLLAYLNEDHIAALHILLPQIEEAARKASGFLGDSIFVLNSEDGVSHLDARSLNAVLNSPRLESVFGQNHIMFLRVALVMHQGLNLRNRLAHGLLLPEEYNRVASDVALQCLLILGLLRPVPLPPAPKAESDG